MYDKNVVLRNTNGEVNSMGNDYELTKEDLLNINGGLMSAKDLASTLEVIKVYKEKGIAKKDLILITRGLGELSSDKSMASGSSFTVDEFIAYVDKNWDSI